MADQQAREGDRVVAESIAQIERLATEMNHSSQAMGQLKSESDKIGSVLDVIKSVAQQTNLLALNAAMADMVRSTVNSIAPRATLPQEQQTPHSPVGGAPPRRLADKVRPKNQKHRSEVAGALEQKTEPEGSVACHQPGTYCASFLWRTRCGWEAASPRRFLRSASYSV
ncbi:Methyl-accepting chemotaxis protein McpS [compost metagenome]